jgi:hypothetical protein
MPIHTYLLLFEASVERTGKPILAGRHGKSAGDVFHGFSYAKPVDEMFQF